MSRVRGTRVLFAALVLIALAGLYGAAGLRHPAAAAGVQRTPSVRVPVSSAVLACAAPGTAGPTAATLAVAAVPGSASTQTTSTGTARVTRLVPGGSPVAGQALANLTQPGVLHVTAVPTAAALPKNLATARPGSSPNVSTATGRGGVMLTASGAMARGLAAEQVTAGRPTAQCGAPTTSSWFVAPGQSTAGNVELYLMNTDNAPANVQVTAITDVTKGGPVLGNADNGITVPPHSMVTQSLAGLLQSSKVVALQVSTSVGRVVGALRESKSSKDDGTWIPVSQAPARSLVIPGIPQAGGHPVLYIAVPDDGTTANVKVTAVTQRGSYQPTGGTNIALLGGTAYQIPLQSLAGVTGALKLTSSAPIVAAEVLPGGPAGTSQVVMTSGAQLQQQGVLAGSPASPAGSADVIISAPGKAATVSISVGTPTAGASGQGGTMIQVKAGASVIVPVRAPAGSRGTPLTVLVTPQPGSGQVYAGWSVSSGKKLLSVQPVASAYTSVPLPPVHVGLSPAP